MGSVRSFSACSAAFIRALLGMLPFSLRTCKNRNLAASSGSSGRAFPPLFLFSFRYSHFRFVVSGLRYPLTFGGLEVGCDGKPEQQTHASEPKNADHPSNQVLIRHFYIPPHPYTDLQSKPLPKYGSIATSSATPTAATSSTLSLLFPSAPFIIRGKEVPTSGRGEASHLTMRNTCIMNLREREHIP